MRAEHCFHGLNDRIVRDSRSKPTEITLKVQDGKEGENELVGHF